MAKGGRIKLQSDPFTPLQEIGPTAEADPAEDSTGLVNTLEKLTKKNAELELRLQESEETLRAIRQYLVDAFVVRRGDTDEVVTLANADYPYHVMVESMNEGAVTLIADGTIFYANPRFARMVGLETEGLVGTRFQDLINPEDLGKFERIFEQASQTGTRVDFCLKTAEGRCLPVQLSLYKLASGKTSAVAIIATDISERQRAEEKIRSLASELTIAEQEERHRISQVLHDDLQQRLFAIKAQLSFLHEALAVDQLPPRAQSELEQIQDALSEAIYVTRNLSVDLSPAVLHGEGLSEAIAWLASRMKEKQGLQVDLKTDPDFPDLERNTRVMLFQAIRELLFNVTKHSGTLEASIALEQAGPMAQITVSDAGRGFDAEAMLNDPQKTHGLSILQDRLNLRGCSMEVSSRPGQGTRVIIKIPPERSAAPE